MLNILNSEQAKKLDEYTIEKGTSNGILINNAAGELMYFIKENFPEAKKVYSFGGPGFNGADVVKLTLMLKLNGVADAEVLDLKMATEEDVLAAEESAEDADIIVDGIFGTGLNREAEGKYKTAIEAINRLHEKGKTVIAVDIPSGINCSDGKVMGTAVRADYTVTFQNLKYGHVLFPGKAYCGKTVCLPIGLDMSGIDSEGFGTAAFCFEKDDVKKMLPKRRPDSNKGSFGRQLIIAGSDYMPGAAVLAAKAAYRTGSGPVTVCSGERTLMQVVSSVPEAILLSDRKAPDFGLYDAVVIGPGLSKTEETVKKIKSIMDYTITSVMSRLDGEGKTVFIIDADGINIIAEEMDRKRILGPERRLRYLMEEFPEQTVFTPHKKEMSRLFGIPMEELRQGLTELSDMIEKHASQIFVLKDAATIVVTKGRKYINTSGNDGLSTAGSGDVLTGIMASFTAKSKNKEELFERACLAVYLHGLAGEKASDKFSNYGVLAGDLPEAAAVCLAELVK